MTATPSGLERECVQRLRRHLAEHSEDTRLSAYELGRNALGSGVGVLDMGAMLMRAIFRVLLETGSEGDPPPREAIEAFVLEALSPFEMAHRGAREANLALRRMDEAREDEIRRMARELHDTAGQMLATVHLALDDVERELGPRARPGIERVQVLLVRVEEQLRRLSHEFLPPMLEDLGLEPALEHLAQVLTRRTGMRIAVETSLEQRLPSKFEVALYRAAQEALSNAARHSRATHVTVSLETGEASVICRIEDDGVGFDPSAHGARESLGLGLKGIRERAARLGGTLVVRSANGQGTRLTLTLPMETGYAIARADRG
jgi:signal transduction histidine kinase